jgi:hypothetical protein
MSVIGGGGSQWQQEEHEEQSQQLLQESESSYTLDSSMMGRLTTGRLVNKDKSRWHIFLIACILFSLNITNLYYPT